MPRFLATWPRWGTTLNGIASARLTSALLTSGTEYGLEPSDGGGLFPTPLSVPSSEASHGSLSGRYREAMARRLQPHPTEAVGPNSLGLWPTATTADHGTRSQWPSPSGPDYSRVGREGTGGDDLATAVARTTWPTPMATDAKWRGSPRAAARRMAIGKQPGLEGAVAVDAALRAETWPTPRASEWKGTGPIGSKSHDYRAAKHYLDATVQERTGESGPLNPPWVEWLMGFPIGWTDLDVDEPLVLEGEPWPPEPAGVPRMARGVPRRAARLKQLGNAVVPQNAELVGYRLLELLEGVEPE